MRVLDHQQAQNPAIVWITPPLFSLIAISFPPLFYFQSPTHNVLQLAAVSTTHNMQQPENIPPGIKQQLKQH